MENKRGSLALHYRQAPELEALCAQAMQAALDASPGMTLLHGKMVLEPKPAARSKGSAIEAFMQEAPFAGRTPVFIGDDITDEVGFATRAASRAAWASRWAKARPSPGAACPTAATCARS